MDPVLAKPTSACCLTDSSSYQSNDPESKLQQIGGIETYVSQPNASDANGNILLFFPDAFGLCAKNYLLMDKFAALGYLVLGVDYFMGVCTRFCAFNNSSLTKFSITGLCAKTYDKPTKRSDFRPEGLEPETPQSLGRSS